jgi:hypothetical protein
VRTAIPGPSPPTHTFVEVSLAPGRIPVRSFPIGHNPAAILIMRALPCGQQVRSHWLEIGEPQVGIVSPDCTSLFEILNEKQIASRVIDLRIHDRTLVGGYRQAIAYGSIDEFQIANEMIGEAHKADRKSGAF